LVTGGARGIGRGIVERFVAEGAVSVAILDVDGDAARATADELADRAAVAAFPVDLADVDAVGPAVAAAVAHGGGRLDVLVNNAGVFAKTPLRATTVADWDRVQAVNCRAALLTIQAAAAALEWSGRSGRARVVNMASMAARRGTPGEAAYAASKAGLVALSRVAAQELGPCGITVNAVCPGYVLTDLGADTRSEADVARWAAASPLGRLATVGDVAGVVAFLASDDGAYLTGQALDVSGGMVMP
jgi:3-oxoacyl-[acyl-carrier protein] reductase